MDVTREVDLESPVDEVWELLTDSAELSGWFGDDVSLDATPGGEATFVEDGQVRRAVVEEVDAGRHLAFRWWVEGDEESASRVAFTLTETDAGTHLTVTETVASASAAPVGSVGDRRPSWPVFTHRTLVGLEWRCMALARV